MRLGLPRSGLLLLITGVSLCAQEAPAGFDLRGTATVEGLYANALSERPGNAPAVDGGFRAVMYPTIKLDDHWTISGALQAISRPYFREDFYSQGHGIRGRVLQANIGYAKLWNQSSIVIRAGQMSTAFGAFLLRYDDSENPLTGMPLGYGYYYDPVGTLGVLALQADLTVHKWDTRVQIANSSPANPRSIFDKDQYRNWAGGFGYTIRQGLRIGVSGYRGPYLYRGYRYFFPGESNPSRLPATALGIDGQSAVSHWNIYGEWQKFIMPYHAIHTFREHTGYLEVKRTLHPRWYVAARAGYLSNSLNSGNQLFEGAIGFRPNSRQILKLGYDALRTTSKGEIDGAFTVQLVTTFHPASIAWKN